MSELSTEHRLFIEARMAIATMLGKDDKGAESYLIEKIDRCLLDQMTLRDFISAFHQASPSDGFTHDGFPKRPHSFTWTNAAALAAKKFAFQYAKPMED